MNFNFVVPLQWSENTMKMMDSFQVMNASDSSYSSLKKTMNFIAIKVQIMIYVSSNINHPVLIYMSKTK